MGKRVDETEAKHANEDLPGTVLPGERAALTADFDISQLPCQLLAQFWYLLLAKRNAA